MRRRAERGQTNPEYLGLLVLVALLIVSILTFGPAAIAAELKAKVCEIARVDGCANNGPSGPSTPPKPVGLSAADVKRMVTHGGVRPGTVVSAEVLRDEALFNFLIDNHILPVPATFLRPCSGPNGIGAIPCEPPTGHHLDYAAFASRWFGNEVVPAVAISVTALALWTAYPPGQVAPAEDEAELQTLRQEFAQLLHRRELGLDTATKQFRLDEANLGSRLEAVVGRLTRSLDRTEDWLDSYNRAYDGIGSNITSARYQLESYSHAIAEHLTNRDLYKVVVDLSGLSPMQASEVTNYVETLSSTDQARIMIMR